MDLHRVEKSEKYHKLCSHLNPGWKSHVFTVEVGAKGFVNNKSFFRTFGNLGLSSRDSKKLLQDCSRAVIRCSYVIWVNRFNKNMIMSNMSDFTPPSSLIFGNSSPTCNDSSESCVALDSPSSPQLSSCPEHNQAEVGLGLVPKPVANKPSSSPNSLHPISEVLSDRTSIIFLDSDPIGPLCRKDRYYEGTFKALCPITSDTIQFKAFDHGAYPWGRDPSKGALATICFSLGITTKSGVFNCCLFVHLLVGILELKLVSVDELLSDYSQILEKYLSSIITREDSKVVNDVLVSFGLLDKICVRFVAYAFDGFLLSLQQFGNRSCPTIFIAHKDNHFFLAKSFPLLLL